MNRPETERPNFFAPAEVLLIGSLPFHAEAEALRWLKRFSLPVSVRPQLPFAGAGYDMIGEVEGTRFSFPESEHSIAFKDQLAGPSVYREARLRAGESKEIALSRLLTVFEEQLDILSQKKGKKIFLLDEPALFLPGSIGPQEDTLELLEDYVLQIRQRGILAGVHCCQRAISEKAAKVLLNVSIDILSVPLSFGNLALLENAFKSGKQLCLGLEEVVIDLGVDRILEETDRLATRSDVALETMLQKTMFSAECGFATILPERAAKSIERLIELREVVRRRFPGICA